MMNQDGFTARDKAKELVDKIYNVIIKQDNVLNGMDKSKDLALLFCTEICNYEFFGSHTQNYWREVKKQIEKL